MPVSPAILGPNAAPLIGRRRIEAAMNPALSQVVLHAACRLIVIWVPCGADYFDGLRFPVSGAPPIVASCNKPSSL